MLCWRRCGNSWARPGYAALTAENVRIAVNQEFIDGEAAELRSGDEVAFLPPVTGG